MPKSNNQLANEVGRRILKLREELGWTQDTLADRAGLSLNFIACVERGEKGLGFDSIIKISRALSTSTDYLLTGAMPQAEHDYIQALFEPLNDIQRQVVVGMIESVKKIIEYRPPAI